MAKQSHIQRQDKREKLVAKALEYIGQLEAQQDEGELPETTGDSIAAEFQRYLRRRGSDGPN